jgi:hypothetical protein
MNRQILRQAQDDLSNRSHPAAMKGSLRDDFRSKERGKLKSHLSHSEGIFFRKKGMLLSQFAIDPTTMSTEVLTFATSKDA